MALHPIHRIPNELLADILFHCTPAIYHSVHERSFILAPSQVCHHWRSLALSTPALWTLVLIVVIQSESDIIRELECARAWLVRSGQLPLTIKYIDPNISSTEAIFPVLIEYCRRWKEIELPPFVYKSCIWSPAEGNLPLLHSASIQLIISRHEPGSGGLDTFAIVPRLRSLSLLLSQPSGTLGPIASVPWKQLTHLDINTFATPAVHELLSLASKLECLIVNLRHRRTNSSTGSKVVTLANLSTFSIYNNDDMVSEFFDHLALPSLRHLTWFNYSFDEIPNSRSFISLLLRSQCNLSSLHMLKIPYLVELLQLVPALEELSVGSFADVEQWDSMVKALGSQNSHRLLPRLRSLEVGYPRSQSGSPVKLDHFTDMVASRWRPEDMSLGSTLKHVKVEFYQGISSPDPVLAPLRKYVEEGLDILFEECLHGVRRRIFP